MPYEVENEQELDDIRQRIKVAQEWALSHFNAHLAGEESMIDDDGNMLPPHAKVTFDNHVNMIVDMEMFGKPIGIPFRYTLHLPKDGGVYWQAMNPLYNTPMPPLVVVQSPSTDAISEKFLPLVEAMQNRPSPTLKQALRLGTIVSAMREERE